MGYIDWYRVLRSIRALVRGEFLLAAAILVGGALHFLFMRALKARETTKAWVFGSILFVLHICLAMGLLYLFGFSFAWVLVAVCLVYLFFAEIGCEKLRQEQGALSEKWLVPLILSMFLASICLIVALLWM